MNTTGYCGKLPQRGDFVSGRIPSTFTNTWDDWAQQLVTACNEIKQQTSNNPWFSLPVYRFYLSSGIAGENAWLGIVLPSCDSVGRQYPFCIARDIEPGCSPSAALILHQEFFQQAEQLIKRLFNNDVNFADLNETLSHLDATTTAASDTYNSATLSKQSAEPLCIRLTTPADPSDEMLWNNAATALLSASFSAFSVWSTSPLSNSTQETLICEGMPSASICSGLLTGDFNPLLWTQFTNLDRPPEFRDQNIFTKDAPAQIPPAPLTDDSEDTKPLRMKRDPNLPRETDFLELDDDSDQSDAPWDN